MQLKFQVATKIQKPLAEVFDAVQNHQQALHEWLGFAWYWAKGYL